MSAAERERALDLKQRRAKQIRALKSALHDMHKFGLGLGESLRDVMP